MMIGYTLGQVASSFITLFRLLPLVLTNKFSNEPIPTEPQAESGNVVISLTTHGKRLDVAYFAIESAARGTVKAPIVLWLDEADYYAEWPETLRRLVRRGLQVRMSDGGYGPHTKYWNQFRAVHDPERGATNRVVTIDDDIVYPEWFLERLLFIANLRDDVVVAYRAHHMQFRGGELQPYAQWRPADTPRASYLHFATGVSGVCYPVSYINFVVGQGDAFQQSCPRADDIWLHACALRSGHPVRQVYAKPCNFAVIPSAQIGGLVLGNALRGGNDAQIAQVYTEEDMRELRECAAAEGR